MPNSSIRSMIGYYQIGGSNNYDDDGHVDILDEEVLLLSNIAVSNKMVAAILFHIPNQSIVFAEDVLQVLMFSTPFVQRIDFVQGF